MKERTEQWPEPRPWWMNTAETAATFAILLAFGAPVAVVTESVYAAAAVAVVGALLFNIVWWKVVKGERLSDVYPALAPWVKE